MRFFAAALDGMAKEASTTAARMTRGAPQTAGFGVRCSGAEIELFRCIIFP
jgi:hypothetical protein